jgi:hypothetical protein
MDPHSRAQLARQVYQRALAAARAAPTPRRWRKLVAAAQNVRVALLDRERARLAALAPSVRALAVVAREPPRHARVLVPFPSPRAGPGWSELVREWERARALVAESQRIVRQARALCGMSDPAPPGARRRARRSASGLVGSR